MKNWLPTLIAFVVPLAASLIAGFLAAIVLVGSHPDLLPEAMQRPVLLLLWACVIGVPFWFSYRTFCAIKRRSGL